MLTLRWSISLWFKTMMQMKAFNTCALSLLPIFIINFNDASFCTSAFDHIFWSCSFESEESRPLQNNSIIGHCHLLGQLLSSVWWIEHIVIYYDMVKWFRQCLFGWMKSGVMLVSHIRAHNKMYQTYINYIQTNVFLSELKGDRRRNS